MCCTGRERSTWFNVARLKVFVAVRMDAQDEARFTMAVNGTLR